MARQILEQGHHLITMARHRNDALEAVAQTHQATLQQWQHDLSAPDTAAQQLRSWLSAQEASRYARVVLINNAGVIPPLHRCRIQTGALSATHCVWVWKPPCC